MLNRKYTAAMERSAKAEERIAAATEKIAASITAMLRGDKSTRENTNGNPHPSVNGNPAKSESTRRT